MINAVRYTTRSCKNQIMSHKLRIEIKFRALAYWGALFKGTPAEGSKR
jgi:hypothetical protein